MEHDEESVLTFLAMNRCSLAQRDNVKIGQRFRHLKTGKIVTVKDIAIIEENLTIAVVYNEGLTTWIRPASEFIDGRFEEVTD